MLILVSLQRVKNEKNQETKQKGHINFFLWNSAKKKSGFEGEKHIEKRRNV